jgi:thiamine-phosphate pyrophosphorylase
MTARQLPRIWLVTDERMGDRLDNGLARLPSGGGILFRHYSLAEEARRALFERILASARTRRQSVLLAGPPERAAAWGADGWHGWDGGRGLHSASVHSLQEMRRAEALGAALLFLGPVYATRTHPGAPALGIRRFARLVAHARRPVIALGGVHRENSAALLRLGAYGWAGIDAWL